MIVVNCVVDTRASGDGKNLHEICERAIAAKKAWGTHKSV